MTKGKKRKTVELYNHGASVSSANARTAKIDLKRRRVVTTALREVPAAEDPLPTTSAAESSADDGYSGMSSNDLEGSPPDVSSDIEGLVIRTTCRAKRYANSVSFNRNILQRTSKTESLRQDIPLLTWVKYRTQFLLEMLRLKGRGDSPSTTCVDCSVGKAEYRCRDCLGDDLVCSACCAKRHVKLPLHVVEVSLVLLLSEICLTLLRF